MQKDSTEFMGFSYCFIVGKDGMRIIRLTSLTQTSKSVANMQLYVKKRRPDLGRQWFQDWVSEYEVFKVCT